MRRGLVVGIFVGAVLTLVLHTDGFSQALEEEIMIPVPRMVQALPKQEFRPGEDLEIRVAAGALPLSHPGLAEVASAFREAGVRDVHVVAAEAPASGSVFLAPADHAAAQELLQRHGVQFDAEMSDEGYALRIDGEGVWIVAPAPAGLFYGLMTLRQLVAAEGGKQLAGRQILDWPVLKFRGISDDISRGQVSTLAHFKKIIRFMARYKMNTYMLYLEDMFRFKKYPSIGRGRGALSAKEVRELQDFARDYFVQIIPIFQTLGHYENILNQPEFMHLADFPGAASLSPGKPEVYDFLRDLLDEIAPAFDSPYFHMGADESWDVGKGKSRALVAKSDIATVHAQHYRRVADLLRRHGKKVMMYGDIVLQHPTILTQLPQDIIVVDWHYGAALDYPSVRVFERAGQPYIVSPGMSDWHRLFPNFTNAFLNIFYLTRQGAEHGALGSIVSTWGDYGGVNFREWNWAGYAFAAACSWHPEAVDMTGFPQKFFRHFYGRRAIFASTLYNLLSEMGGSITFNEVWSHPFAPYRRAGRQRLRQAARMAVMARNALRFCDLLAESATKNREQIDYLRFAARLGRWLAEKQKFVLEWWAQQKRELDEQTAAAMRETGAAKCKELRTALQELKEEYRRLWLRCARPENLDLILALFDLQAHYWEDLAEQIRNGNFFEDPSLPGAFVYFGQEKDQRAQRAYFRRRFVLKKKPKKAWLQVINDGVVESWANGKKVGESHARWALSLRVHEAMVQMIDVTRYLRRGENVLAFSAQNFGEKAAAGLHASLFAEFGDGSVFRMLSDKYWKSADREFPDWQNPDFDDGSWFPALEERKDIFISRPDFAHGLKSRVDTR